MQVAQKGSNGASKGSPVVILFRGETMTPSVFVRRYPALTEENHHGGSFVRPSGTESVDAFLNYVPIGRRKQEPHGRLGQVSQRRARRLKNNTKGKYWCRCRHCMRSFIRDRIRDHEASCAMNPVNEQLVECSFCSHLDHPDKIGAHESACPSKPGVQKCEVEAVAS